jgi:UDP-GlcNAc3NAcA epimerase
MKVVSIIGARPQFIKCAPLSRALRKAHQEIIVHTGQHYDPEMSDVFFTELEIPKPDYNLGVGSGSHGKQTGKMLEKIEAVLLKEKPDFVVVYGDTNSTLAGALAAVKLHIPVAHVEAGLRSFDRSMPEEINRIVTDHMSDLLFCPTQCAVDNLLKEGITKGVHLVGDVMMDALNYNKPLAESKSGILKQLNLESGEYLVLTVHRPSNTDSRENMQNILSAIGKSGRITVFPVHPRTQKYLREYSLWESLSPAIRGTRPLGYLDMVKLMAHAEKILTDSGGMQKEAYMLGIPCISLRDTTEWVETLEEGWNVLAGTDQETILSYIKQDKVISKNKKQYFGDGCAAEKIVNALNIFITYDTSSYHT